MNEADKRDRTIRLYIRMCRDSGFRIPFNQAAALVGDILKTSALVVWAEMGLTILDMQTIAEGKHRSLKENGGRY